MAWKSLRRKNRGNIFFIDTKHSSLIKHVGRLDGVERKKEKKKKEKRSTANFNIEAKWRTLMRESSLSLFFSSPLKNNPCLELETQSFSHAWLRERTRFHKGLKLLLYVCRIDDITCKCINDGKYSFQRCFIQKSIIWLIWWKRYNGTVQ